MESKVSQSGNNAAARGDNAVLALSNVDLKLLRVFKCVVEAGGLTAASNELNIGLAAISKQLSDLEIRLGMTLCSRGREGFELTEYGVNVYQATLELFVSLNHFRERLHNSRDEILGEIAISVVDNTISDPLSPVTSAVQKLHRLAPKVHIRLQTAQLDDIERGISEGRFHCAIAPAYEYKNEFDYFPLYIEQSRLYCAREHPLFPLNPAAISPDILQQQVMVNHLYVSQRYKNRLFSRQESHIQAVQVESVAMLILTGQFIGYLPEHYAARYIQQGDLRELSDEALRLKTPFCLMIKKGRKINQIIRLFMQALAIPENEELH